MAKPAKSDDKIFQEAKQKLGELIKKEQDPSAVVDLVNALTKMKAVELKMGEEEFGSGLDA